MATYNFDSTGSTEYLAENISASQATTWNITQSGDGSSYFTLETVADFDGKYSSSTVKGVSGSFATSSGVTVLTKDDYHMSAVIEKGGATITFTPSQYVSSSQMLVRGTGGEGILPPTSPELILDASNLSSYPGTGTTWFDISGNGRNATLNNDPTWNSSGYFELDGNDDWVDAIDTATILDGAFTVEVAIWPTVDSYNSGPGGRVVWSTHDPTYTNRYIFVISPDVGLIRTYSPTHTLTTTALGDQWRLLTIVNDGSVSDNLKTYIDGVLESTVTYTHTSNAYFQLGMEYDSSVAGDFYLGKYGGAKVYDRVLTQGEIWTNYHIFKNQYGV